MGKKVKMSPLGEIHFHRRRGTKNMRLSVTYDGKIRVSMPVWAPYKMGEAFVVSKTLWLEKQLASKHSVHIANNSHIGKAHRVVVMPTKSNRITSRVTENEITLYLPPIVSLSSKEAQEALRKAAVKALKQEAETLLPKRLNELSQATGLTYSSLSIKQLRSRWGSCNSKKEIALNCYLMQLPWELIDYVILHELTHTVVMAHGPKFWSEVAKHLPNYKEKRQQIRQYQPTLLPT